MKFKKLLLGTALTAGTVFAVGTTSANADEIHTIQTDDTLAKISKQYVGDKSLIDSIVEANDIKDKNMIYVGEELTIPTDGNSGQEQAPVQQEAPVQEEQQAPVQEAQPAEPAQPVEEEQTPQQPVEEPAQAEEPATEEADNSGDSSVEVNDHLKQIAQRESGGDIHATNPSSGASGKYQFLQTTWDSVAPAEYQGSPAANAPEEVQDAAAQKLYDTAGASQWVTA
ncbi:transglycosylase family protein [Tetragenococcus halophilus]|uniref:Transglycosylase family protein n=1 Tax=Tetragenococcus halophilus TaxID=51669 RepID=A0AB35HRX0_TETHA|nr:transglycosylase family protein [Tetragenococcus halophilus]MCO8295683.1 transglycosylase family protein [Tetragenococcus halophilus]MCO8298856.1 transglycosylase family protein [Tetragenococcus halophilus]